MLQCEQCEFFCREEGTGRIQMRCNPFATIKEPECLAKHQLLRLEALLGAYHATLRWYQKLGPMQEKMFEMMKREMEDLDEAEQWKYESRERKGDEDEEQDDEPLRPDNDDEKKEQDDGGRDEDGFSRPYR